LKAEVLRAIVCKMKSFICHGINFKNSANCVDVIKGFATNHMMAFAKNQNFTKILLEALVNGPLILREILVKSIGENEGMSKAMLSYIRHCIVKKEIRDVNPEHLMINIVGMNLIYFISAPIALGLSEVGKFRRGMGIAIIGGLIGSTFLSLVVVPAVFDYIDGFRLWTRKLFHRPALREINKINSNIEV
jgi:Cu/Ag efflux pump CusA